MDFASLGCFSHAKNIRLTLALTFQDLCAKICSFAMPTFQKVHFRVLIELPFVAEVKLEKVVGYLCSALTGEDEHGVASDGQSKVAASRRNVTALIYLPTWTTERHTSHHNKTKSVGTVDKISYPQHWFSVINSTQAAFFQRHVLIL